MIPMILTVTSKKTETAIFTKTLNFILYSQKKDIICYSSVQNRIYSFFINISIFS